MSYRAQSITIQELINEIDDRHNYFLPAIQRSFVWSASKTEDLFDSILRGYPIGTLLIWDVGPSAIREFEFYELIKDYSGLTPDNRKANLANKEACYGILDGQQRITSLYIGLLGSRRDRVFRGIWNDPKYYPETKLYINLLYKPVDEDAEHKYQLRFLTDQQARHSEGIFWFRVGDILKYKKRLDLMPFRQNSGYKDEPVFESNLDTLWSAIHEQHNISYFMEKEQILDEVLRIFIRLNTGGTPLSYSDLLLSLATATWKTHDARGGINTLVADLNGKCGADFSFDKDFVLKALLVFNDGDVRFKTENIKKKARLEDIWETAQVSLKTAVELVADFGFNWQTLTAKNAVIPIAYYIFKRSLGASFLSHDAYESERESIRLWLLKVLLGRAFRVGTDQVLTSIREIIRKKIAIDGTDAIFPSDEILDDLRSKRYFGFDDIALTQLIGETTYGSSSAFVLLSLLGSHLNFQYNNYHIDHLHPIALLDREHLAALGVSEEDMQFAIEHRDRLGNLQLLPGPKNILKSDTQLDAWLNKQPNQSLVRSLSMIPEIDLSLRNFRTFFLEREQLLRASLKQKLGVTTEQAYDSNSSVEQVPLEDDSEE